MNESYNQINSNQPTMAIPGLAIGASLGAAFGHVALRRKVASSQQIFNMLNQVSKTNHQATASLGAQILYPSAYGVIGGGLGFLGGNQLKRKQD